ncbi:uncharacterized protein LOC144654842 [Oculina patagonica]
MNSCFLFLILADCKTVMNSNTSPFQQTSCLNETKEQNYEARGPDLTLTAGGSISNAKTTRGRRHSACSYLPRHAMTPAISEAVSPSDTPVTQEISSSANTGFVGLHRRRKTSLPSQMVLKPDQFLEGGRVEVAKREVNLEARMPVFTKEPGTVKKSSTTPLTQTEANGWMFENIGGNMGGNQRPRQRRISLPVLKVDKTDSPPALPSCNSGSSGELNNNLLTPSSIPRVRSGPLIGKKAEARQWSQSF